MSVFADLTGRNVPERCTQWLGYRILNGCRSNRKLAVTNREVNFVSDPACAWLVNPVVREATMLENGLIVQAEVGLEFRPLRVHSVTQHSKSRTTFAFTSSFIGSRPARTGLPEFPSFLSLEISRCLHFYALGAFPLR